jgi:hypothetical protein
MRTARQRMAADLKIAGYRESGDKICLLSGGWPTRNRLLRRK